MFYLYIIQSLINKRYYIGSTNNLERRLKEHHEGKSKYTKTTKPFKLVYKENYKSLREARKREAYLKRLKSKKYINYLIQTNNT